MSKKENKQYLIVENIYIFYHNFEGHSAQFKHNIL